MRGFHDKVFRIGNHGLLAPGRRAPEDKGHGLFAGIQQFDNLIGKLLPSFPLMGSRLMGADRQYRVQKQNTLLRPGLQAAVVRHRTA